MVTQLNVRIISDPSIVVTSDSDRADVEIYAIPAERRIRICASLVAEDALFAVKQPVI